MPNKEKGYISHHAISPIQEFKSIDRDQLISDGIKFINSPYLWGGRSPFHPELSTPCTSVDCSGLVNLLYRLQGKDIPRDAHDQFLQCKKCEFHDLQKGDLIFHAPKTKPHRIDHVMLFIEDDQFLEAALSVGKIHMTTAQKRYGLSFNKINNEQIVGDYVIHFGYF